MQRTLLLSASILVLFSALAQADVVFTEVGTSAGLRIVHDPLGYTNGSASIQNLYGPGVAIEDINGDAWLDVIIANGTAGNRVLLNNGDWTFTDVTTSFGIDPSRVGNGIAVADLENDGTLDFIVANYFDEPQFYVNSGGVAVDFAPQMGIVPLLPGADPIFGPEPESMGAAFGDYNQDGFVDLYVANYRDQQDVLYRSSLGSYFNYDDSARATEEGYGFQAVFLDFDDDGDRDIYVANDFGYNYMLRNEGQASGWAFTEVAVQDNVSGDQNNSFPKSMSMGLAIGDYDNDLDQDILVTNFELNALYQNDGAGLRPGIWKWTDVAAARGVEYPINCWGIEFVDLDNDRDLDLVQSSGYIFSNQFDQPIENPDQFWLNDGPSNNYHFTNISEAAGFNSTLMGRGLATGDLDRDGDVDVIVTNNTYYDPSPDDVEFTLYEGHSLVYRNDQDASNNWVNLRLEGMKGRGGAVNRCAIGARVYLTAGGLTQMREVQSGVGYISHSSMELEFGLGASTAIDEVRVIWTNGDEELFTGVTPNGFFKLVEGAGSAGPVPVALSSFRARPLDGGVMLEWETAPGMHTVAVEVLRAAAGSEDLLRRVEAEVSIGNAGGTAFDRAVVTDHEYAYQLVLLGADGSRTRSAVARVKARSGATPGLLRAVVGQNFPNPFNPTTSIQFELPRDMHARLVIYDAQGRFVRTLHDDFTRAGLVTVEWDGRDEQGSAVASGVYSYALHSEDGSSARRMVLTR